MSGSPPYAQPSRQLQRRVHRWVAQSRDLVQELETSGLAVNPGYREDVPQEIRAPAREDGKPIGPDEPWPPPMGWPAVLARLEGLEELELAFPESFGTVPYSVLFAEGC